MTHRSDARPQIELCRPRRRATKGCQPGDGESRRLSSRAQNLRRSTSGQLAAAPVKLKLLRVAVTFQRPTMKRTVFDIPKMDCAAEERLVRLALQEAPVRQIDFDLPNRRLTVVHDFDAQQLLALLAPLNLRASLAESSDVETLDDRANAAVDLTEQKTLMTLLAINALMFVVELTTGWISQSTGLVSDSLDMFADAAVYGLSLYSVGKPAGIQKSAARLSGYLQLALAVGAFAEVARRLVFGSEPEASTMIGIAFLALIANVACLLLISKHRKGGVHMRASWIFSTNDVIANLGVIGAAALVAWSGSAIPDLVIGTVIAAVVLSGALRILRLSRRP